MRKAVWKIGTLLCLMCLFVCGFKSEVKATTLVAPEDRVYTPVVLTPVTPKSRMVMVYAESDTTLEIKNDKGVIVSKEIKDTGINKIKLPKQKKNTKLKFSLTNNLNNKKGATVKVTVKNQKYKSVKFSAKAKKSGKVVIKGNKGDTVYIQEVSGGVRSEWTQVGIILCKKNKMTIQLPQATKGVSYRIKLKRLGGKYTKAIKVKGKTAASKGDEWETNSGMVVGCSHGCDSSQVSYD